LLLVGVASLAALIGFMSNNWYRDLRERHTSKTQNKAATASQVLSRVFAPGGTSTVAYAGSVAASTRPPETTPPPDHSASNLRVDGAKLAEVRLAAEPERTTQANEFLYVQVGFYSHNAEAHSLVERLRKRGFIAYASELGSSQLYRVQLGPYTTSESADMTQDALKEVGFDSFEAVENKRIQMRP
jgi:cell division protein FtsN